MLKSDSLLSSGKSRTSPARILRVQIMVLGLLFVVLSLAAAGQEFTVEMGAFPSPAAIDPGGSTAASVTVTPGTGFSGTVLLTCQVTAQATGATPPQCFVSPTSVTPPASATVTVTSTGLVTPGRYSITATGTISGTTTSASATPVPLTVLAVTPQYTITVTEPVAPSSVHAGSGGTGTVSVNPLSGYSIPSGGVTLSCSSITPLVTAPPVCSFNPNPLPAGEASSTLTISTTGPTEPTTAALIGGGYAAWLSLPALALAGLAALSRKQSRLACFALAVFVAGGTLLLIPACGAPSTITRTPSNLITPNDTYTFTLMGVDANGVSSSNTGTNSAAPTVTLTVD